MTSEFVFTKSVSSAAHFAQSLRVFVHTQFAGELVCVMMTIMADGRWFKKEDCCLGGKWQQHLATNSRDLRENNKPCGMQSALGDDAQGF